MGKLTAAVTVTCCAHIPNPMRRAQNIDRGGECCRYDRSMPVLVLSALTTVFLLLLVLLPVSAAAQQTEDEALPLPRWDRQPAAPAQEPPAPGTELGAQFNNLLPQDSPILPASADPFSTLDTGPRLSDGPPSVLQGYGELGPLDLSLFLHGSLLNQPGAAAASVPTRPTPAMALRDAPPEVLKLARDTPANEHLLDPQTLVSEIPREDLERFLEFHAREGRIRLYILVLKSHQRLPAGAILDDLAHGALTRGHACLAVYPLGEPWRARFLVSQSVRDSVPATSLTDLAEDCIKDALQASDAEQQLHRFGVRLSTRLFSVEKFLPAPAANPSEVSPSHLSEVASAQAAQAADTAIGPFVLSPLMLWSLVCIGMISIGALGLGFHLMRRTRTRSRPQSHVWMLPDPEVVPRLGGAFSGGAGSMMSYRE